MFSSPGFSSRSLLKVSGTAFGFSAVYVDLPQYRRQGILLEIKLNVLFSA